MYQIFQFGRTENYVWRIYDKNISEMAEKGDSSDSESPIIDDNIIRIQLRKPCQRKWELRTRNHSPGIKFPTIQLFDCDGNLLVETNDDNISIKSSDFDERGLKTSQSLRDFKHFIGKNAVKKRNSISGAKVYTRVYRSVSLKDDSADVGAKSYVIRDGTSVVNIPSKLTLNNNLTNLQANSLETTPFESECFSDISSYKSSDNENHEKVKRPYETNNRAVCQNGAISNLSSDHSSISSLSAANQSANVVSSDKENEVRDVGLHKSQSFNGNTFRDGSDTVVTLSRSKSGVTYKPPHNKVSFLNTYLKSLPARMNSNPDWFTLHRRTIEDRESSRTARRQELPNISFAKIRRCKTGDNTSDNEFINIPTDFAADCEMKKRLKMYRRGLSEIEQRQRNSSLFTKKRRHSVSGLMRACLTSSSESVDEADVVLNRLKRRILKNKLREKRRSLGEKFQFNQRVQANQERCAASQRDAGGGARLRSRRAMGSNISQHSAKGLKGRRARSSGDLCNGDSKSQTESSVCGSVVGDVMGWNRSLPNHLDGNRHLADYSRVNNNYGDFGTYNRCHPKGGRGLRYRVSKSGES
ncbi:uncharacterized protein LOC114354236 [Ostrinia furnacalis]|uniref:uncharacterized protein LOC114354236 n=1 Tax=Ostrinia furnacalis TaxID=93504 RepID=UPI00103AEA45|nr:uncharacterized protein LOC114354236 [Ostrinia furnacalis]